MPEGLRLLARLNTDTQSHHAEADSDVDYFLFRPDICAESYRTFLARLYGFLLPLETALATAPGLEEVIDIQPRAKAAHVYHDLLALGMTPVEVAELPQCLTIPSFRGPAAALGWMYVVERPMLANAVIRGHLGSLLPVETAQASAFLCAYAGHAGSLWRELGEAMDKVAYTPAIADRIVGAACDAFRCLHRWRTIELTSMRIAG